MHSKKKKTTMTCIGTEWNTESATRCGILSTSSMIVSTFKTLATKDSRKPAARGS